MKQLGCLDSRGIWIPGQQGMADFEMRPDFWRQPFTMGTLLTTASTWNIDELWVHHSALARIGELRMLVGGWDIFPKMPEKRGRYHAYMPGHHGQAIDIVIPAYPSGQDSESPWNAAPDGQSLITQVQAYNTALRFDFRWTPGATGTALMRAVHGGGQSRDRRYLQLDTPQKPPPPATMTTAPARDISWIRALIEDERRYRYLHAFDKNAAYLGAPAALELGLGAWQHVKEPYLDKFETCHPGYWRIQHATWNDRQYVGQIPDLLMPDGAGNAWITTPVLQCAIEHHIDMYCSESYVWPEHSRVLAPWQARLRVARQELRDYPLALSVLKLTYSSAVYSLDGSWLRGQDEPAMLYRPDWKHAVIGQAAANFWRDMAKATRNGVHVAAARTDCMYVVSDLPADETAQRTGLPFGPNIGQYKIVQQNIPLDEVLPFFGDRPSLWDLASYLVQRGREYAISSASGSAASA